MRWFRRKASNSEQWTPVLLNYEPGIYQPVVGESLRYSYIQEFIGLGDEGECDLMAILRREPDNAVDENAVQVLFDKYVVGYLPKRLARSYQPELKTIERQRRYPVCSARLYWNYNYDETGEFLASITLRAAGPGKLIP